MKDPLVPALQTSPVLRVVAGMILLKTDPEKPLETVENSPRHSMEYMPTLTPQTTAIGLMDLSGGKPPG